LFVGLFAGAEPVAAAGGWSFGGGVAESDVAALGSAADGAVAGGDEGAAGTDVDDAAGAAFSGAEARCKKPRAANTSATTPSPLATAMKMDLRILSR
jgi:hypothetical protein